MAKIQNKKTNRAGLATKAILSGVFALIILGLVFIPKAKADFWDDVVDFLDPTQHIGNIIDGEPWKNLPPIPSREEIIDPLCLFACDDNDNDARTAYVALPSVTIYANPSSVNYDGSTTIYWNSSNATFCHSIGRTIGWSGNKPTSGSYYAPNLRNTTTFHITCSNSAGSSGNSVTVTVGAEQQNPTVSIHASPSTVNYNGSAVISWNSNNASYCSASGGTNGWAGNKNLSGTFNTGNLTNTTTYQITCTNSSGSVNGSATVYVSGAQTQNPTVSIDADDSSLDYGESTRIRWNSNNADYCTASGGTNGWSGNRNTSGSFYTGQMTSDKTFRINCYNNSGSDSDSVTVRVVDDDDNDYNDNTRVSISAARTRIGLNESTTIRWDSDNAEYCRGSGGLNGWAGTRNRSGSFNTGPLPRTTTFTIICGNDNYNYNYYYGYNNYNNEVSRSVSVVVSGNQPLPPQSGNYLTATTTAATQISNTSARVNSVISNSRNLPANAWFEWGRTMSLGNKTAVTPIGTSPSVVHADNLNGLSPRTTYYYRIVAENSEWRNIGSMLSFTTTGTPRTEVIKTTKTSYTPPSSLVLVSSSIDRNQPITSTIDNSRPRPGDEINYTINYQNVGTASITSLTMRVDLPLEVDYLFSNRNNPIISGHTLIFNLGTLKANGQDTLSIRTRVRTDIPSGTNLNFPATLTYIDPSGSPQMVTTNVSAQVWSQSELGGSEDEFGDEDPFAANALFSDSFFPTNIFGWLFLIILLLVLILLSRNVYSKFTETRIKHTTEDHL